MHWGMFDDDETCDLDYVFPFKPLPPHVANHCCPENQGDVLKFK